MDQEEKFENSFYIPRCKERYCNGLLKLFFDFDDFSVNYQCDKNPNHKGKNISLDALNNLCIKLKKINQCYKCSLFLENDCEYKCAQCENIYCHNCYYYDEHIKKDIKNLRKKQNKCLIHNSPKSYFCENCDKNICPLCYKNNSCKQHKVKNLFDIIPTNYEINSLNNKIKEKINYLKNLINSINTWQEKLINKINNIKGNLEIEIEIMEKLFKNYNQNFLNFTYHSNFKDFHKYIQISNNKSLTHFYNCTLFEDQMLNMSKIMCSKNLKISQKNGILKEIIGKEIGKIAKINDKYILYYSENNKKIMIAFYREENDKPHISYEENAYIDFDYPIYSICPSIENQRVYICLSNKKWVKIIDFDLEDQNIKMAGEIIKDDSNSENEHFYKCLEVKNGLVATNDDNSIIIWRQNNVNKLYSKKIVISLNGFGKPSDLLIANNEYIITCLSERKKIHFYDINNFELIKVFENIDSVGKDCLILDKKFLIVNCINGIAIITYKPKKAIRYIMNYEGYDNKILGIGINGNYYILTCSHNLCIMKLQFDNGYFLPVEEFKDVEIENNNNSNNLVPKEIENIAVNNNNILVWGKCIFVLKEKEDNN